MASTDASCSEWFVKRIDFLGREAVPILCQNENGPCPLLAIANCLTLRNQLSISASNPKMELSPLISRVAEKILDSNAVDSSKASETYVLNLAANIDDCLSVLGKLNVGLDVNPKFHDVEGFEPTKELTVFDLLDIRIFHGWVVDPQDVETARVLGTRSYNELVEVLVSCLDADAVERIESETRLPLRGASSLSSTAAAAAVGAATADAVQASGGRASVDASGATGVAGEGHVAAAAGGSTAAEYVDRGAAASTGSANGPPMAAEAAESAGGGAGNAGGAAELAGGAAERAGGAAERAGGAAERAGGAAESTGGAAESAGGVAPSAGGAAENADGAATGSQAAFAEPAAAGDAQRAHDAAIIREFFEVHCSQLTQAGLAGISAKMRENQLAVFFRNNHFSVVFKYEGQLYLLVTDQGYYRESGVVWERLDRVDGNTQMCGPGFQPYTAPPPAGADVTGAANPYAGLSEEDAAAIALAATEGLEDVDPALLAAAGGGGDDAPPQPLQQPQPAGVQPALVGGGTAAAAGGGDGQASAGAGAVTGHSQSHGADVDADMAFAMQLQEQEEYEARRAEEARRLHEQQLAQQQQLQQGQQQPPQPQQQAGQQQQQQRQPKAPAARQQPAPPRGQMTARQMQQQALVAQQQQAAQQAAYMAAQQQRHAQARAGQAAAATGARSTRVQSARPAAAAPAAKDESSCVVS